MINIIKRVILKIIGVGEHYQTTISNNIYVTKETLEIIKILKRKGMV